MVNYLIGSIQVIYAVTMTGWHGQKALGFTLGLDDDKEVVTMAAPDIIKQLVKEMFDDMPSFTPKHIMMPTIGDPPLGTIPEMGDPTRDAVLTRMSKTRHILGKMVYASNAYPTAIFPTNTLCARMSAPHELDNKALAFMVSHLGEYGHLECNRYGGWNTYGLEQRELFNPFTIGKKAMHYHHFSDASVDMPGVSGGAAFLAGGLIQGLTQRQHLKATGSHDNELVAGGTNLNFCIMINGILQELHIRLGSATPLYFDSLSTVFVAKSDQSEKKSIWLRRRAAVLQEGHDHNEIVPIHISGTDMVADAFTKYLVLRVWRRLMHYACNVSGDAPPA